MPTQQSAEREARRARLPATVLPGRNHDACCSLADQDTAHRQLATPWPPAAQTPAPEPRERAQSRRSSRAHALRATGRQRTCLRSSASRRGSRARRAPRNRSRSPSGSGLRTSRRAPPTPSAKHALGRVRPPTACAHQMKGGARTRMHTCRARAPPSRRRPSSTGGIIAREARGAFALVARKLVASRRKSSL